MDPTMIRVISGVLFVVIVFVILARRKGMATKRKRPPLVPRSTLRKTA